MTTRNPYDRLARIGRHVGDAALGTLAVIFVVSMGFYAAAKLGWWALLLVPGLALMAATVVGLVLLDGAVSRWWWRKSSQWESRNRRTVPTEILIPKNGDHDD